MGNSSIGKNTSRQPWGLTVTNISFFYSFDVIYKKNITPSQLWCNKFTTEFLNYSSLSKKKKTCGFFNLLSICSQIKKFLPALNLAGLTRGYFFFIPETGFFNLAVSGPFWIRRNLPPKFHFPMENGKVDSPPPPGWTTELHPCLVKARLPRELLIFLRPLNWLWFRSNMKIKKNHKHYMFVIS